MEAIRKGNEVFEESALLYSKWFYSPSLNIKITFARRNEREKKREIFQLAIYESSLGGMYSMVLWVHKVGRTFRTFITYYFRNTSTSYLRTFLFSTKKALNHRISSCFELMCHHYFLYLYIET